MIMTALVGYSGFVGSNIYAAGKFDAVYNSKNIREAYGTNPDLLIYAGLRAEKYLANHAPQKDMELISLAKDNISKINPKKLVLISTIDVLGNSENMDEDSIVKAEDLNPYGYNRYQLEIWVRERYPDSLIIRLPGLFGRNLKKNFIYDFMNRIPFMLSSEKFEELSRETSSLKQFYNLKENGFYQVNVKESEKEHLKEVFSKLGFSALNFTDSRSMYQYYNLKSLWEDIQIALKNNIRLWHPATEPVTAAELYKYLTGQEFKNILDAPPARYNCKSIDAEAFGGKNRYICTKEQILTDIKSFVIEEKTYGKI